MNKSVRGKIQANNFLKCVFGFAEHHETGTIGLAKKLYSKRGIDCDFFISAGGTEAKKIDIKDISWSVPQYTPSIRDNTRPSKHNISENVN